MEPSPPDPNWPRYSPAPFPPYRFVPGRSPHPRRHPKGHSYGLPEPKPPAFAPEAWRECGEYLRGIDLYNFAYWWECHEALEGLWHAVGHATTQGQCLQGIIQVAAANLKRFQGREATARGLAAKGLNRLAGLPRPYMGLDAAEFESQVTDYFGSRRAVPALIRLTKGGEG